MFTALRHEIALGQGILFAGLTSGLQFSSINFLWSPEFWALLSARFSTVWKKVLFILLLLVCTGLAIAIAPATASAIIPNVQWWSAGGSIIYLNGSEAELFPDYLGAGATLGDECLVAGNNLCPSAYWEQLRDNHIKFLTNITIFDSGTNATFWNGESRRSPVPSFVHGSNSNIAFWSYARSLPARGGDYYDAAAEGTSNFTVASIAHHAVVDGAVMGAMHWNKATRLSTYAGSRPRKFAWRQQDRSRTTPMWIPWGHTRCTNKSHVVGAKGPPLFPDFRNLDFNVTTTGTPPEMDAWMALTLPSLSRPETFWFDLDSSMAHNGSIGMVVAVPTSNVSVVDLYGCITDARWVTNYYDINFSSMFAQGQPLADPAGDSARGNVFNFGGRQCHYGPAYAKYLNPTIHPTNRTVLQEMLAATAFWVEGPGPNQWQSSGYLPHLEAVLNILLVNGMSRTAPYTAPFQQLKNFNGEWWLDFMPDAGSPLGRPSKSAYVLPSNLSNFVTFNVSGDVYGYAYSHDNQVTYLSMIILFLYLPIGVGIMAWTIFSGISSSSWETLSELLILALKSSPPPKELTVGTSTGFSSLQPLRERYCVVVKENKLELKVFDGDVPIEERVETNVAYE